MKKLLALILSLIIVFAFTACGSDAGEEAQTAEEKELLVRYYDEATNKYGFCTKDGEKRIEPLFNDADSFASNGLARVYVDGKGWGYINEKGEYVIEPQFDEAYSFAGNGFAWVKVDDKYHYINEKGEIIQPK